jgi:hypothetical protein
MVILLFEIVLYAAGPIIALYFASQGYKTYRKLEFVANLIFAVILIVWPDPIITLMVFNY